MVVAVLLVMSMQVTEIFVRGAATLFLSLSLEQTVLSWSVFLSDLLYGIAGIIVRNAILWHFFGGIVELLHK